MAKELTLEEANAEIARLKALEIDLAKKLQDSEKALEKLAAENKSLKDTLTAKEEEIEVLILEAESAAEKVAEITKEVPGTYTAKNKKTYRFCKGQFFIIFKGEKQKTTDLLKNSKAMEELIEIGAGSIEVVND